MKKIGHGGMKYYGYTKPTPTHKRVKSSILNKNAVLPIQKRINKTPYNVSPMNRNMNTQMEVVNGFSYVPQGQNTFDRQKDLRNDQNKSFNRNRSRKKYREGSSESNISDSYFKSFDSKRIKKKKKVKKVLPESRIHPNFN